MPQDRRQPSSGLTRRNVLVGGAALGIAVVAAACQQAPEIKPDIDDLQAQLDLASRDAAAAAAASAANPPVAPALDAVAAMRRAHHDALSKELARAAGSTSTKPTSSTTTASAAPPPDVDQIKTQLRDSSRSAMDLAVKSSGYRAGLLASISAACASSAEVDLP